MSASPHPHLTEEEYLKIERAAEFRRCQAAPIRTVRSTPSIRTFLPGRTRTLGYQRRAFTTAPRTAISSLFGTISNTYPCSGLIFTISCTQRLRNATLTKRALGPVI